MANLWELSPRALHRKLFNKIGLSDRGKEAKCGKLTEDDAEAIRSNHKFLRTEKDDLSNSWEVRLARKYYERLFREYCVVDLSLYKYGCLGMRWRTEAEVVEGKGQFVCGAKHCSEDHRALCTYEVNFVYKEDGERKQTLVKVRLCPECAIKMNYQRDKTASSIERLKKDQGTSKKRRRDSKKDRPKGKRPAIDKESLRSDNENKSGARVSSEELDEDTMEEYLESMLL